MKRLLVAAGGIGLGLVVAVSGGSASASARVDAPRLQVVASNLDNPRKLFVAPDGSVYVVLAGVGGNKGSQSCLQTCVGETGSVVRISDGAVKQILTGLGSHSLPGGRDAEGPVAAMPSGS